MQVRRREQLRNGALLHLAGAGMAGCGGVLAHVAGWQRITPEPTRPPQILGLVAGEPDDPGLGGNARRAPRPGQIVHGPPRTQRPSLLDSAHHRGERDPEGPRHDGTAGAVGIGHQHQGSGGSRGLPREAFQVGAVCGADGQGRNGAGMGHGAHLPEQIDRAHPNHLNHSTYQNGYARWPRSGWGEMGPNRPRWVGP